MCAAVPITKPKDYEEPAETAPQLPTEGSMVVNRRCHLERRDERGWHVVVFEAEPDSPRRQPRLALPCRLLEKMEQFTRSKPGAIFRISGQNSNYDGRCFILLQKAVLELEPPPATTKARATFHGAKPTTSQPTGPATAPTTGATKPAAAATGPSTGLTAPAPKPAGPTSDDILAALRRDSPGKGIVPEVRPKDNRPNEPSVAPLPKEKVLSPGRGGAVVDRLVTIIPAARGRWMQVRFESDNTLREPPMRLLPCALLREAKLTVASAQRGKTIRLRISGLITFYRGKRFLLLRKVLRERDLGRF